MGLESNRLEKDVAVVTGAGSGICRAVSLKLALNGATVACLDINEQGINDTVKMITDKGGKAFGVKVDVGDSFQVKKAMEEVYNKTGKISILVNGAAIISYTPLEKCTDEEWEKIMRVDITGYFYCLREAFPYIIRSGNGRIVQFSSSTAFSGSGFAGPHYTAAKAATIGLTKYVAGCWAKYGIRVNTICPGLTETNIVTLEGGEIKDKKDHEIKIPLGRIAKPEEMANVVIFLVSQESSYITGATLHVNGGKYIYGS